jgi:hypothetical protein
LWLKDKPQLETMVVIDLPEDVFFDNGKKKTTKLNVGHLQRIQSYHLHVPVVV